MVKTEPYFPLQGFRFCFDSIMFVLWHYEQIQEGDWPKPISGYTDTPLVQTSMRGGAKFCGPAEIWAEIDERLNGHIDQKTGRRVGGCGADGRLAFNHHAKGVTLEDLAQFNGQDIYKIQRRINRAIAYCCGWRRRPYSYSEWKQHRRFKRPIKENQPSLDNKNIANGQNATIQLRWN